MHRHKHTFLPFNRKSHCLSNKQLADLLTVDHGVISHLEAGDRPPRLDVALGLQVIFDKQPRELFPDLYREVEEKVINQAVALEQELLGKKGHCAANQRAALLKMVQRANPVPAHV